VHLYRGAKVLLTVCEVLSACYFDRIHCSGSNMYMMPRNNLGRFWWFYLLFFTLFRELIVGKKLKAIFSRMLAACSYLPWKVQRSSVCFTVLTCGVALFAVCGTSYMRKML
jgi:hypothetical protein